MKHASLFSGIGGFDLAAEWMGWENVFHCEWNPFGQKILKHYWPNSELFTDITKSDFKKYANTIDILTGGFPCQPYSAAGKRLGKEDERHLWPEMLRVIREVAPRYVVGENVRGLTNWNGGVVFDEVCADLENLGYQVAPYLIPASGVNAPHRRERIWFIAYRGFVRQYTGGAEQSLPRDSSNGEKKLITDTDSGRLERTTEVGRNGKHVERKSIVGTTANTDQRTTRPPGESGSLESNGSDGHILEEQRGAEAELDNRLHEFLRNASDADGVRQFEREREYEEHADQRGVNALDDINANADGGNASDTNGRRIQRYRPISKNNEIQTNKCYKNDSKKQCRMDWEKFPTQPPICGGDDGISSELDGITFSKWRNESIKAYGNAVVPQVVYQIFKAIQKYENL
jgi:DNA (cytosine-5)-methyltransferase 1